MCYCCWCPEGIQGQGYRSTGFSLTRKSTHRSTVVMWLHRPVWGVQLGRGWMSRVPPCRYARVAVPEIPLEKIEKSFSRSSGPGGQNVNKVNTKAEIRFNLHEADWIPLELKQRFQQLFPNRINKEGEVIITSEKTRYQHTNLEVAQTQSLLTGAGLCE